MPQATIQLDANLRGATEQFIALARRVKDVDGGLSQLARSASKAATEIEKAGGAKGNLSKHADRASQSVNSLIGQFTSIVSVSAAVHQAISLVTAAVGAEGAAAQEAAARLKELATLQKELAGASNYRLKDTIENEQTAYRLGVKTKTNRTEALATLRKALGEGYGESDAEAAMQFGRVSGVEGTRLFEFLGKSQELGSPISARDAANLLIKMQDPKGIGATGAGALEIGDKVITAGTASGLSSMQSLQLAASAGEILSGKKAAGALNKIFDALKPYEASYTAPGKNGEKTTWTQALEGNFAERLMQLKTERPGAWADLVGDPEIAQLLPRLGDALNTKPVGDELDRAIAARDANQGARAYDDLQQTDSATAATDAAIGNQQMRIDAKRKRLAAALRQQGKLSDVDIYAATNLFPGAARWWGGFTGRSLDAEESQLDATAQTYGVNIAAENVVSGRTGTAQIGPNEFISNDEMAAMQRKADRTGYLYGGEEGRGKTAAEESSREYERLIELKREEMRLQQQRDDDAQRERKAQTSLMQRRPWNGSLRDWRAEDNLYANAGYGDTSARGMYLG